MTQQEAVVMSVTTEPRALRPRRWPTHTYTVSLGRLTHPPVPGDLIDTLPGIFWRVLTVDLVADGVTMTLEPVKGHSPEAHGRVRPMRGGELL